MKFLIALILVVLSLQSYAKKPPTKTEFVNHAWARDIAKSFEYNEYLNSLLVVKTMESRNEDKINKMFGKKGKIKRSIFFMNDPKMHDSFLTKLKKHKFVKYGKNNKIKANVQDLTSTERHSKESFREFSSTLEDFRKKNSTKYREFIIIAGKLYDKCKSTVEFNKNVFCMAIVYKEDKENIQSREKFIRFVAGESQYKNKIK